MPKIGSVGTKKKTQPNPWKLQTLEAKLCRMADKLLVLPTALFLYKNQMRKFGIDPKQVDDSDLRKAAELDRLWQEDLKRRVVALGGTWK